MLNSHSELHVLGEVFGSHDLFYADVKSLPRDPIPDTVAALAAVWECGDAFAMHDYQTDYAWTAVDDELLRMSELKILWLERKDRFLQAISAELAHQSQVWHRRPHENELRPGQYDVRLERMLYFARDTARCRVESRDRFAEFESLDLVYEEIVANPQRELDRILEFLGVAKAPAVVAYAPTRGDRNLGDYVPNHEELRKKFRAALETTAVAMDDTARCDTGRCPSSELLAASETTAGL